jgi:hypothetical protein
LKLPIRPEKALETAGTSIESVLLDLKNLTFTPGRDRAVITQLAKKDSGMRPGPCLVGNKEEEAL